MEAQKDKISSLNVASGDIELGFGRHEVTIKVQSRPTSVHLDIRDPCDGHQVCHGDVNRISVTIMDDGFLIVADIRTNTACVDWACAF